MSGDDDQSPQKKDNGDGLDRVSEYIIMRKFHGNHKLNLWLFQNLMMHRMRT